MAGSGHKQWAAGDVVGASGDTDINTALLEQIVGVYAASANRDAAFGGAGEPTLAEGMLCYLNDTNEFQVYNGSAWVSIGDPEVVIVDSANARVGVNIAAPDNTLHVLEASAGTVAAHADTQVAIENSGTAGIQFLTNSGEENRIIFGDAADNDIGGITYDHDGNSIRWTTNAAERMRLDSSGQLGIGNDTPAGRLDLGDGTGRKLFLYSGGGANTSGLGVDLGGNSYEASIYFSSSGRLTIGSHNGSAYDTHVTVLASGAVDFEGTVSKAGGSFDIPHPTKGGDWRLRHSFIEGPKADNIYRGTVTLSAGTATVDLDAASNMTDGTWEAMNRDPWTMVASSGNAVEWSLSGKTLAITGPADAVCNWMVIGERQDDFMKSDKCALADDDGYLIVEYERPADPPYDPPYDVTD